MNLIELNGSGKDLWAFMTTAVIALLTTGALWFLMEEVNNYVRWRRWSHDARLQFTIGTRIGMLAWLRGHGHTNWMWQTGAWWRLLINSDSGVRDPPQAIGLSACEVVSRYAGRHSWKRFRPFELDDVYEWTWRTSKAKRWLLGFFR